MSSDACIIDALLRRSNTLNRRRPGCILAEVVGDGNAPIEIRRKAARYILRQYEGDTTDAAAE